MDIKLLVRKRVKELRNKLGVSQEELTDIVGLDRAYITSVECGKRKYFYREYRKACKSIKRNSCRIF